MQSGAKCARREAAAEVPFPHTGKPWFEALPAEQRVEMERSFREELSKDRELVRAQRRYAFIDIGLTSIVFLAFDQLFAPHATFGSGLFSLVAGAAVGLFCVLVNANRLVTAAVGLVAFFLVQILSRGGLSALHMFVFFPFAAVCTILGYKREERGYDA